MGGDGMHAESMGMGNAPFRRVLVPLEFETAADGDIENERAVELAPRQWVTIGPASVESLRLANRIARYVCLVHATPDLAMTSMYGGIEGTGIAESALVELDENARRQSIEALRQFASRYFEDAVVEYSVKPGAAIDVILDAAREHEVDAIVIAASGRSRVRRFVLGSTTDKVIRRASCPVIVMPAV